VETYGYRSRDYIVPGNFDIPPVFCIYDIDHDKMPELILVSDDGDWEPYFDVFTYTNNTVNKVGSIKCDWFGQIGSPDNISSGLFSADSYKGHYGKLYHYTIQDGVLVERLVCEWHLRPGPNENAYAYIYNIDGSILSSIEGDVSYVEKSYYEYKQIRYTAFDFYKITEKNIKEVLYSS
jgi:hypothetical protein